MLSKEEELFREFERALGKDGQHFSKDNQIRVHRSLLDLAFNARSEVEWAKYREKKTDRSNGTEKKLSRLERLTAITGSSTRKRQR